MDLPENLDHSDYILRPFTIFEIEDFLDSDFYDELDRTFPEINDGFDSHSFDLGSKYFLNDKNPEFERVLDSRPAWQHLKDSFEQQETFDRLGALIGKKWHFLSSEDLSRRQPLLRENSRIGRHMHHLRCAFAFPQKVRLAFEFSILEPGASITPHTDNAFKLLSLMLYFPNSETQTGMGTEFYSGLGGSPAKRAWSAPIMSRAETDRFFQDHEIFYRSEFTRNKLVGFVKSAVSWHGLSCVGGELPRRSVNINVYAA